jgi:uncharacterized protein YdhG (YjbR/CyaY superfamily)
VVSDPKSVDDYLAALPAGMRDALEQLRATIRSAAPDAIEGFSYGMPAFKQDGRPLVGYAAFKEHCSLFPMSVAVIDAHAEQVAPYRTGKGTLSFPPDEPLPSDLVASLVAARLAENAARRRRR